MQRLTATVDAPVTLRVLPAALALLMAASAHADGILGTWAGEYTCRQGLTGLTLTIQEAAGGRARALFHFYESPANPGVPEGCFMLEGRYDPVRGEIAFRQDHWLLQPPHYGMVDMKGRISDDGQTFTGDVFPLPGCTTFTLDRLSEPKPTPIECSPSQLLSMR